MPFTVTSAIQCEINTIIDTISPGCGLVDIYMTARKVQNLHAADNVALEDIVTAVIARAQANGLPMEFDPRRLLNGDDVVDVVDLLEEDPMIMPETIIAAA
jgi:hypothetical protein